MQTTGSETLGQVNPFCHFVGARGRISVPDSKMGARLSGRPIVLDVDSEAGHGIGSPREHSRLSAEMKTRSGCTLGVQARDLHI